MCTRNWWDRPVWGNRCIRVACVAVLRFTTLYWVSAGLPFSQSTFCLGRFSQSQISGELISPDCCSTKPCTTATYIFFMVRRSNCLPKCDCAGLLRAKIIKPEVAISKRCTTNAVGNCAFTLSNRLCGDASPGTESRSVGLFTTTISSSQCSNSN